MSDTGPLRDRDNEIEALKRRLAELEEQKVQTSESTESPEAPDVLLDVAPRDLHIPLFEPAASEEAFLLHRVAAQFGLSASLALQGPEDIQSRKHWSEKVTPYKHQIRNLLTFCRRAPVALIADDVGLGKTISAGLILSELMTRGKVRRAIVLCPKILLPQWAEELQTKFGISATYGSGSTIYALLNSDYDVVITTYETARDRLEEIEKFSFDMLILDEAHKLRNLFGTAKPPVIAQRMHAALQARAFKYVVMLTATPIQNRLWDLYSLVEMLTTAKGHEHPLGNPARFVRRYIADGAQQARELNPGTKDEFRRKLAQYMVRARREDCDLIFPERKVQTIRAAGTPIDTKLMGIVRGMIGTLNALLQISLSQALMSSPRAFMKQIDRMEERGTVGRSEARQVRQICGEGGQPSKLPQLLSIIESLRKEDPERWRAVIFTTRKETQSYLVEMLEDMDIRCGTIRGGQASKNQKSIKGFWNDLPDVNVLVSTDAGAEGVNLQCANVVINYDLPWNPMVVEQRIGRVQRLASTHQYVIVLNLVVAGSVEERIVSRLIEKLQVIAHSIGDIEGILSSSKGEAGRDDGFETMVRKMVVNAFQGQNMEEAVKAASENIEAAKKIYEDERETVDTTLGRLDVMHESGPKPPKLPPTEPDLSVREFTLRALPEERGRIEHDGSGRTWHRAPGKAPERITFDEAEYEQERVMHSGFGGPSTALYAEGRPSFERLVGRWTARSPHWICQPVDSQDGETEEIAREWAQILKAPSIHSVEVTNGNASFAGKVWIRASAAVSHDKYEKLIELELGDRGRALPPSIETEICPATQDLREHIADCERHLGSAIAADQDLGAFTKFYEARWKEEVQRAGTDPERREAIRQQFSPHVTGAVIAAEGTVRPENSAKILYGPTGDEQYEVTLVIDPFDSRVTSWTDLEYCEHSGIGLEKGILRKCTITGKLVAPHLLITSGLSGREALAEHATKCEETQRAILKDEAVQSSVSGRILGKDLVEQCAVTGRNASRSEMAACDITGALVLPDQLEQSELSGKHYRVDQQRIGKALGLRGHESEFVLCGISRAIVEPAATVESSVSGIVGRKDLMVESQKSPGRWATSDEVVTCGETGKRLMPDETARCTVTKVVADSDLFVHSAKSGHPVLERVAIKCQKSEKWLLPAEAVASDASGLLVDRALLRPSAVSGKLALPEEMSRCSKSGVLVLPQELETCEETGRQVRSDHMGTCAISGKRVHRSQLVPVEPSGRTILRRIAVKTAAHGTLCEPEAAKRCQWTGQTCAPKETAVCSRSGLLVERGALQRTKILELDEIFHRSGSIPKAGPADASWAIRHVRENLKRGTDVRVWSAGRAGLLVFVIRKRALLGLSTRHFGVIAEKRSAGLELLGTFE